MLAYNKKKLDTWLTRKTTQEAADLGWISETEKQNILAKYPTPFFSPRTIVRIGLGFSTMVAVTMCFSFIQMVLGINIGDYITHLVFGSAVIVLLEYMIREKDHYRSGIDDMLLYAGYGILFSGVISIFDRAPNPSVVLTANATALAVVGSVRYADRLMAGISLIAFILFTYFLAERTDHQLWFMLPFIGGIVSLAAWFGSTYYLNDARVRYYRHCLKFIQLIGLIILGICTNYFIADAWFLEHGENIAGFWKGFYIATTIAIPLLTIITGFSRKDKKRIRVGALMVAAAVITYHHYFSSMPVEIGCIFYGSLLLIVSYWLLKHHKARENGISFSEKQDGRELFEMESLLVGAGVSMIIPEQHADRFGGGSYGGAGGGSQY